MRALMPWAGMTSLKQEMDRLFERFSTIQVKAA